MNRKNTFFNWHLRNGKTLHNLTQKQFFAENVKITDIRSKDATDA